LLNGYKSAAGGSGNRAPQFWVTDADWPSFIEKSALRADAFLARLSDGEFQQGMAALRDAGNAISQSDAVSEEIDWFVLRRG